MPQGRSFRFTWKDSSLLQGLRGWHRTWIRSERTLKIIGQYVTEISKQSFDRQARPAGGPWKKLSPKYAAWKAKNRYSSNILEKTRQLKGSIAYSIQPAGMRPSVIIGPTAHHGIHHQFGAPRAGIPARPFMGLGRNHEAEIRRIVSKWISGVTR